MSLSGQHTFDKREALTCLAVRAYLEASWIADSFCMVPTRMAVKVSALSA